MSEVEFWIVDDPPTEELADRAFAAGFDDGIVTIAAGGAATIELHHRNGELHRLIRDAISRAEAGGLKVRQVIMPREAFTSAY